jgi:hypothetical protein
MWFLLVRPLVRPAFDLVDLVAKDLLPAIHSRFDCLPTVVRL